MNTHNDQGCTEIEPALLSSAERLSRSELTTRVRRYISHRKNRKYIYRRFNDVTFGAEGGSILYTCILCRTFNIYLYIAYCIFYNILKSMCISYLIWIFSVFIVYCTKFKIYNILRLCSFP